MAKELVTIQRVIKMKKYIKIKNNEIVISEDNWKTLNSKFGKEEIKEAISDIIEDTPIPLPKPVITRNKCKTDFEALCRYDDSELVMVNSEFFSRYEYNYPFSNCVIRSTNIGNKSSDFFHLDNRWLCDSINSPSPYRSWTIKKFRMTLLNALWSLKFDSIDTTKLRAAIAMRKYIASQFRPSAAKAIYNHFNARDVLDFSSGWGDRLSGFLASDAVSYVGIDPNERLIKGYKSQIRTLSKNNKKVKMINGCAEDVDLSGMEFDFIFTSPPYYNIERYTQEDNQSFKKYRKFEDWMENFLFRTIDNVWPTLKVGGKLVINISDVYSNHKVNKICDAMNNYIANKKGASYHGCYGYEIRKRLNSGALKGRKDGTLAEPMWIWTKVK